MFFENFDLENIVSPVDVTQLEQLLIQTGYDKSETKFLVNGFTNGFDIGYRGDQKVKLQSHNLKLRNPGDHVVLWNKVMKEVKLKRFAGPYSHIPYSDEAYIQSPIGLVPKDNGSDSRLIFHLSYPRNSGLSLNENTPKELCSVQYPDFQKAIQLCLRAGVGCGVSKSDLTSAFRNLGIRRIDWKWLILKARSPIDNKIYYFVDKCLPFGASISCALFQRFSNALSHIVKVKSKGKENVNYLDDFLFVALLAALCNKQVDTFIQICNQIKFPVSIRKTFYASTTMVFLGLLIDTISQMVLIPADKIDKARILISNILDKKRNKITINQLQKICGFLNFQGQYVVPGRAFTRRLYAHIKEGLKPHHHVRITGEMRKDLLMWREFIDHPTIYSRPFADFETNNPAPIIQMYSDAAKKAGLGYGGICGNSWLYGIWDDSFLRECDPSIEYLELYALVTTVLNWIHRYSNKRVTLHCDNQAVVHMVNNTSSSCKNCMVLIRILVLKCLTENVRLFATYIRSCDNVASDLLSRQKIVEFRALKDSWDDQPTPVNERLCPVRKLWVP